MILTGFNELVYPKYTSHETKHTLTSHNFIQTNSTKAKEGTQLLIDNPFNFSPVHPRNRFNPAHTFSRYSATK